MMGYGAKRLHPSYAQDMILIPVENNQVTEKKLHAIGSIVMIIIGVFVLMNTSPDIARAIMGEMASYRVRIWNLVVVGSEGMMIGAAFLICGLILIFLGLRIVIQTVNSRDA